MHDGEIDTIAKNLWPVIQTERCIAWVGSGISRAVSRERYPKWHEVIQHLFAEFGFDLPKNFHDPESKKKPEKLKKWAEECKQADPDKYTRTLNTHLGHRDYDLTETLRCLFKLPFAGYVTTNVDRLLYRSAEAEMEMAGSNNVFQIYPMVRVAGLSQGEKVCYLHGLADKQNPGQGQFVFSESEFLKAYKRPGNVDSFVKELMKGYHILFLGCDPGEPQLAEIIRNVQEIHRDYSSAPRADWLPRRFLLRAREYTRDASGPGREEPSTAEDDARVARYEMQMGIETLCYECSDEDRQPEVDKVFMRLVEFHRPRRERALAPGLPLPFEEPAT